MPMGSDPGGPAATGANVGDPRADRGPGGLGEQAPP
jgi:hypothetical protein